VGTDISGWVEYQLTGSSSDESMWYPVIRIGCLPSRNYDMFGCLFGVRNSAHFKPIAANRGTPSDVSYDARGELREIADAEPKLRDEFHSYSWIRWAEIKNIDWEEEAEAVDECVHEYRRTADGDLVYVTKSRPTLSPEVWQVLQEEPVWEREEKVYKVEKMKRKDALDWEWQLLFDMMKLLATSYGDEHVRMIVWFNG